MIEHSSEYSNTRHKSLFAFAGINGAGKTTLINGVFNVLGKSGHVPFVSKAYSEERKAVFEGILRTADDIEIMFMFQSFHRRQRNEAVEALVRGDIVLADRWSEAFEEFHSRNGPLSRNPELRRLIGEMAYGGLEPCKTIYLQLDPIIAMQRTSHRGMDFFDSKPSETHVDQALYYDAVAKRDSSWVALDGRATPDELVERAVDIINSTGLI